MQVALEVRSPLLDARVARFGAELAPSIKFRNGLKSVLRELLARHVPRSLFERQKQGFSIPLRSWLRGPLRDTVHETLQQRGLRECGWLEAKSVAAIETRFQQGEDECAAPLWSLFVLADNLRRNSEERTTPNANRKPVLSLGAQRAA